MSQQSERYRYVDIPGALLDHVSRNKVVLFLGAGASIGARLEGGGPILDGSGLGERLSDQFLSGKYKQRPLHEIAEYAISESDMIDVQEFIRVSLESLVPTEAHRMLPKFRWAGLATTNFDLLIERAYSDAERPCQYPVPFVENGDTVDDKLQTSDNIMLLKLHGCITRTRNRDCPLILSTDQYITHRQGRSRIFDSLREWTYERTFVFVGHSLQDTDIRQIILEMRNEGIGRRHYIVDPAMDDVRERYWDGRKISCLRGTFLEFLNKLDSSLESPFRSVFVPSPELRAPALREIPRNRQQDLSSACLGFISRDVDYPRDLENIPSIDPKLFYKGSSEGWSPIEQNLDVRRQLEETILYDYFLDDDASHKNRPTLLVVKGHAGSGKTVFLRRLCWEAASTLEKACLFLRDEGTIASGLVQEYLEAMPGRLYLFVDQASKRLREIRSLFDSLRECAARLTIVTAERINEWNVHCQELSELVAREYVLHYLSESEIDSLLKLLERHKSLGVLERKTAKQREDAFKEVAGRQLLVALHEATLGKKFEDIIEDEYRGVSPFRAQNIYLTICVLNRLGVPVRAGVIARIHGISFEDFKREFFSPLEMVVQVRKNTVLNDYVYSARHPEIAQIVFERILNTQEDRFELFTRCLRGLNIDYSVDRHAVRKMIRGRSVLELFPDHALAEQVLQVASSALGPDAYLYHQSALYELHRPNGSLARVKDLLEKAQGCDPLDPSLKHSLAEYHLRCADVASTLLEEEKHLQAALDIAANLAAPRSTTSHAYHTMLKVHMRRLERCLSTENSDASTRETGILVSRAEETLAGGLQRFPKDGYLLDAEHRLALLLQDSDRAMAALKDAFSTNPRNSFVAARLAKLHTAQGDNSEAESVLKSALAANRGNTQLNYELGCLLMATAGHAPEEVEYYLHRSFSPGDGNARARMLYARQLYINGKIDEARRAFAELSEAHVSYEERNLPSMPLEGRFWGTIVHISGSYGFVRRDGSGDDLYLSPRSVDDADWSILRNGSRVSFRIAFNYKGAMATEVKSNNV